MSEILHFNIFNDTEEHIEHYGVPGMKWGVRKEKELKERKQKQQSLQTQSKITSEIKNITSGKGSIGNAIPNRYDYIVKTHPNYDSLSDEYMNKVIKRKNLENSYAEAVGEMKSTPSKGKIAKESLQTIGAVLGIALTAVTIKSIINQDKIKRLEDLKKEADAAKKKK